MRIRHANLGAAAVIVSASVLLGCGAVDDAPGPDSLPAEDLIGLLQDEKRVQVADFDRLRVSLELEADAELLDPDDLEPSGEDAFFGNLEPGEVSIEREAAAVLGGALPPAIDTRAISEAVGGESTTVLRTSQDWSDLADQLEADGAYRDGRFMLLDGPDEDIAYSPEPGVVVISGFDPRSPTDRELFAGEVDPAIVDALREVPGAWRGAALVRGLPDGTSCVITQAWGEDLPAQSATVSYRLDARPDPELVSSELAQEEWYPSYRVGEARIDGRTVAFDVGFGPGARQFPGEGLPPFNGC